jgi:hypothetical protein
MSLFDKILSIFGINKQKNNIQKSSTNKFKKKRKMSLLRENFISDAPDEEAGGKVNAISQNKTLYIGQFSDAVDEPELFQEATNINSVFEKFKPKIDVEFQDENGDSVQETLAFKDMSDFDVNNGAGKFVTNSSFLMEAKSNIDMNAKMRKQMEQSKRIRDLLGDKQAKEELRNVLQNMLDELEK